MEKLRFKDENGSTYPKWETKYFSETYYKAKEGGTPSTKNNNYYLEGKIPFVKIDDLKQKYLFNSTSYINELGIKNSSAWRIPINSLLLSNGATIGESSITKLEVTTKQGILGIIPKINVEFLYYLVATQKFKKLIKRITTKGTMDAAYIKDIANIKVDIPCENEQNKIADFLSVFDFNIEKVTQKIEQLQLLKKGYLQKMFPKKGENTPEIRFNGFTDAWEQRELGELTEIYDGTHQTPQYTDNGVMFLSVENITTLKSKKFISEEAFKNEFKIYPEKNDILMTRIGDIGTANIVADNEPKAYYVSLALLKNSKLDPHFLMESISSVNVKREIWHRTLHIAFPKKINKNEISKVQLSYPKNKVEQSQIGRTLNQLENLITLHQRKHELLIKIKQGYMQRLFS